MLPYSFTQHRFPLANELDVRGSYLAYEPLQSYGPCMILGQVDELYTVTDGFSIAALKVSTDFILN